MNTPNPFIVIVDRHGTAQDILPGITSDDVVFATIRALDLQYPGDNPHVPWEWDGEEWYEFSHLKRTKQKNNNNNRQRSHVIVKSGKTFTVKKSFNETR